jgi:hypothetical protein
MAETHLRTGRLYADTSRPVETEMSFSAALRILQELAAAQPEVALFQSQLARAHNELGAFYAQLGRVAEAEKAALASLAINQKLVASHPDVITYEENLA